MAAACEGSRDLSPLDHCCQLPRFLNRHGSLPSETVYFLIDTGSLTLNIAYRFTETKKQMLNPPLHGLMFVVKLHFFIRHLDQIIVTVNFLIWFGSFSFVKRAPKLLSMVSKHVGNIILP